MNDIAKLIADKMREPSFLKLASAWPYAEIRFLPITKVGPCSVSDWYVSLPSGKQIVLSDEDWGASDPALKP